jgi:hypothetical protein
MEDSMAACKLRDVFCHATGASIQPRGLSMAMTARSSYKIGIGSQCGNSMELGLAMRHRSSRRQSAQTFRQRKIFWKKMRQVALNLA